MQRIATRLTDLILLKPNVHPDHRGFFMESYNKRGYERLGIDVEFVQDNHSFSKTKGTLRGLHYQRPPMAQSKLIRVLSGRIYDVAVDIRKSSPTYGQWESFVLDDENQCQLFVPAGFAHGFCTMSDYTTVLYKVDQYYSGDHDDGIRWDDPSLSISWPCETPILSDKDNCLPFLDQANLIF